MSILIESIEAILPEKRLDADEVERVLQPHLEENMFCLKQKVPNKIRQCLVNVLVKEKVD